MSDTSDLDYPQEVTVVFNCPECGEKLVMAVPADGGKAELMRFRDLPNDDDVDEDDPDAAE